MDDVFAAARELFEARQRHEASIRRAIGSRWDEVHVASVAGVSVEHVRALCSPAPENTTPTSASPTGPPPASQPHSMHSTGTPLLVEPGTKHQRGGLSCF